jgi:Putative metal-binding motif
MTSPLVRLGLSCLVGFGIALGAGKARAADLIIDGSKTTNDCAGAGGAPINGGRGCSLAGPHAYGNITLTNGAVIEVTVFDNNAANKATLGNLVLKATGNISIDATSRITARGRGYQAVECDDGPGPTATAGGKGGCSVYDSGGGGAHFGKGGKGTKDCFVYGDANTCQFPQEWEEDCSSKVAGACVDDADQDPVTAGRQCYGITASNADVFGDELPSVAGQSYWHHILDPEFGAAGGDKGCRDGYDANNRAGNGGGRIVLFAGGAGSSVTINGRVTTDGKRGCASGNDSAGGGAGGTILIIGDTVNVGQTARISARGGRGGDSQPKALVCTADTDCGTGQLCRTFTEPASGNQYKRCDPANCTPSRVAAPFCDTGYVRRQLGGNLGWVCIPTATDPRNWNACTDNTGCDTQSATECSSASGCLCLDLGGTDVTAGVGKRCVPNNQAICDYLDYGENEDECKGTQNSGVCDDCAGGGGGGIINVQSRINNIDPRSIFDVRGGNGGICPICAGEAGAGAGELQIDAAYVGEICDGKDNNFDGQTDEGLGNISCPDGSTIAACTAGKPGNCPTVTSCNGAVTDTRPRFAVVVDTSGSMLLDNDGEPRFGDGSVDFPGVNGTETRLYNAKGALSDVLAAFPESDYALARYYQDSGLNRSCQTANWFECAQSCCSYDDPRTNNPLQSHDNTTPAYPYYYPDGQCVPSKLYGAGASVDDSLSALNTNINIGWQTPSADCINYSGSCGPPKRGAQYLVDFSQPLSNYLSWLDNKETNFQSGVACTGGDCELRATGPTPLASSLEATKDFLAPRIACDNAVPCRKYNVILLTDGAESCQGDPVAAAAALNAGITKTIMGAPTQISVKTYVIGFSTLPTETAQLNAIAVAGGTTSAYFVSSRAELANAMATIISGSFVFEKCNGKDDDCDGLIDEDFPETQPPTGPGLTCDDGQEGVCKGTGHFICKADGTGSFCNIDMPGGASGKEKCNGIDDNCNGLIDESTAQNPLNCEPCVAQPEICDGLDNDCDNAVDEIADLVDDNQPCGTDVGQCNPGLTVCDMGELKCNGATGPFTEVCDGYDNDCDNVVDGQSQSCYVVTGNAFNDDPNSYQYGECRTGSWKCTAVLNSGVADWGNGMKATSCAGQKVPTVEVCDGKDNNCNNVIDDVNDGGKVVGVECCDPKVKAPALCGTGQCNKGTFACVGPTVSCVNAGVPGEEACDGIDNDCNGSVDDIKTLGSPCTTLGGCPGKLACDADKKAPVCVPNGVQDLEICDGKDNDCDGSVDEDDDVTKNDPLVGKVCDAVVPPNDHPPCASGKTVCANGRIDCQGAIHPVKEVCDLKDTDCDGIADTLSACPGGNACIDGQCDEPCHGGEFPCPGGFDCKSYDGKKYCVPQSCDDAKCPEDSHCRNNKCTPDSQGAGGEGNGAAGAGSTGETSHAGATGAEGGESSGLAGNGTGNESSGGENGTGASTSGGKTGSGATSNEAGRGVFGLVTGGGGCACRTTPSRGGDAALAASLLLLGAMVSRRRRHGEGRAA